MKAIIIGGDERMLRLARLLEKDGHGVFPLALEKALPVQGPPDFGGADCIILPLPAERGGALNAPFSTEKHSLDSLLQSAKPGTTIFAGMAGAGLRELCSQRGLVLRDYFEREELQVKNAALTAEGALALLLRLDDRALFGRQVLICGFGRIGRLLAPRLRALGAEVSIAARSPADRAWAEAMGCRALGIAHAAEGEYDFVLNTVPSPILGATEIERLGGAKLIELASPPYGIDLDAATKADKSITLASGLPAVCAPESAAQAIRDTIYNMLEE